MWEAKNNIGVYGCGVSDLGVRGGNVDDSPHPSGEVFLKFKQTLISFW